MNKMYFYLISILLIVIGFSFSNDVFALHLNEPKITGIEYVNDSSVKILYKTNNINSNYKVQIYNMTNGKYYSSTITSTDYALTGLDTGKTYNIIMRAYYSTSVSEWSNVMSVTPKEGVPVINSVTVSDKQLTLNYNANGSPKEVEIYITNLKKSVKSSNLSSVTITGLTNGTTYTFLMRNCYSDEKCGGWSTSKSGVPSAKSSGGSGITINSSKTYGKYTSLGSFTTGNCEKLANVAKNNGCYTSQSLAITDKYYVVNEICNSNKAAIVLYNISDNKKVKYIATKKIDHANGATYNKRNGNIYITGFQNKKYAVYNASSFSLVKSSNFDFNTTGIAYEYDTNRYYIKNAQKIYIKNSDFKDIKSYSLMRSANQDIEVHKGILFALKWIKSSNSNYVDMYKASSGQYIGSYKIKLGKEIEGMGFLGDVPVFLINSYGAPDFLYISKSAFIFK